MIRPFTIHMCKTRKGEQKQQQTFGIDKWETNCHAKKCFTSSLQCMSQTRKAITKYICSNMFFPEPWALIYTVVVVIGLETFQKNLPTGLYNFLTFASRYISLRNSFLQVALHILLGLVNRQTVSSADVLTAKSSQIH